MEAIQYFDKVEELKIMINNLEIQKIRQSKFSTLDMIEGFSKRGKKLDGREVGMKRIELMQYALAMTKYEDWNTFLDNTSREDILSIIEHFILSSIES